MSVVWLMKCHLFPMPPMASSKGTLVNSEIISKEKILKNKHKSNSINIKIYIFKKKGN